MKKSYIEIAKKVAHHSTHCHKLGAVLIKGGSIINVGFNKLKSHKFARRFNKNYTRHAELMCILGVDRKVTTGATLYIVRLKADDKLGLAKPCKLCQELLMFVGVKKVVYSDNEGNFQRLKL